MIDNPNERTTVRLQKCLDRARNGETAAQEELIQIAWKRLLYLTAKMFRGYPLLRRFEDTDDIFQKAMMRFWESLKRTAAGSLREFFGRASLEIRRTLRDLTRHHFGPERGGGKQAVEIDDATVDRPALTAPDMSPNELTVWEDFHTAIEELSAELREVFELIWYHELIHVEVAQLVGVSVRTVQTRWREARLEVFDKLGGKLPPT
jgi:RNA polymerase sigma-70 factor (ECF subfamily)